MNLHQHPTIHTAILSDADHLNALVRAGLRRHRDDPDVRRSHLLEGRHENIYVGRDRIPELAQVLDRAVALARKILNEPDRPLRAGCWFNDMPPGAATLPHSHDDDDELLSATYYLQIPPDSGELILHDGPTRTVVTPAEGLFVFFPPDVIHEVTRNASDRHRLSLGVNIGPDDPAG